MADTPSSSSSSPSKITVYGVSWRPDCRRAKKFLMGRVLGRILGRFGPEWAGESVGKRWGKRRKASDWTGKVAMNSAQSA